jgi:hypothetical protein
MYYSLWLKLGSPPVFKNRVWIIRGLIRAKITTWYTAKMLASDSVALSFTRHTLKPAWDIRCISGRENRWDGMSNGVELTAPETSHLHPAMK